MRYRGRECTARQFSDETGTGTEYLLDGQVVVREHATRILSPAEVSAQAAANAALMAENRRLVALNLVVEDALRERAAEIDAIMAAKGQSQTET